MQYLSFLQSWLKVYTDEPAHHFLKLLSAIQNDETPQMDVLQSIDETIPTEVMDLGLYIAASKGNRTLLNKVLEFETVKSNAAVDDNNALRVAVRKGHFDVVDRLLEIDTVKNNAAIGNNRALKTAARKGHLNIVDRLLKIDVVEDSLLAHGHEVLLSAARSGQLAVVNRLLKIPTIREKSAAKNNQILCIAAQNGHLDVVDTLLKIPAVKDNAATKNNYALALAAQNGHLNVIDRLLQVPEIIENIREVQDEALMLTVNHRHFHILNRLLEVPKVLDNIANNDNFYLAIAAQNGDLPMLERLLKIPAVEKNAHAGDNYILAVASQFGHLDVVNRLLEIPAVRENAAINDNNALDSAAKYGHLDVVNRLLEIPTVKNNAVTDNNYALPYAIQNGYLNIVERFLEIPLVKAAFDINDYDAEQASMLLTISSVAEIAAKDESFIQRRISLNRNSEQCLDIIKKFSEVPDKINLIDVFRLAVKNEPYREENVRTFLEYIDKNQQIYGLKLKDVFANSNFNVTNLKAFVESPFEYLESHPLSPILSPCQLEAIKILWLTEEVKKADKAKMQQFALNTETAMETDRVRTAEAHFNSKIKPHFKEKFDVMGKTVHDRVLKVESKIRGALLSQIVNNAQEKGLVDIIEFVDKHKRALKTGQNELLMDQARELFSSSEDAAQVAWRAYDKFAPSEGNFENLLTPQKSSSKIFGGAASNEGRISLNKASNESRLRAAYYYLAATDESTECRVDVETRLGIFIIKVAELRRAYNTPNDGEVDKPSCYPGTLGRLADTGSGHPIAEMPPSKIDILIEVILSKRGEKLAKISTLTHSKEEITNLFHGLTALYDQTAQDVLSGKGFIAYNEDHLNARSVFIDSLGDENSILREINEELIARGRSVLKPDELIYLKKYLTDISCVQMERIIKQLRSQIEYGAGASEELSFQEKSQKGKEKESKIENPYTRDLRQRAVLTAFSQRVKTLEIKEGIFEAMSKKIQHVLTEMLPEDPLDSEMLADLTKTLIDELWEPSQNACSDFSTPQVGDVFSEFTGRSSKATIFFNDKFNLSLFCEKMNVPLAAEKEKKEMSQKML